MEVKGVAIRTMLASLEALHGKDLVDEVVAGLPPEPKERIVTRSVVPGTWYPISWYRELVGGVAKLKGQSSLRALGQDTATRDLTSIYKIIFRILSPNTVVQQSDRLFHLYYKGGKVKVSDARPGHVRVEYSECWGFDANMWVDFRGGSEAVLALTGARNVRTIVRGGGTGPLFIADAEWD